LESDVSELQPHAAHLGPLQECVVLVGLPVARPVDFHARGWPIRLTFG
jgi:hypothetical protein